MNGCRWSVGNEANIKLMSDPWLRGKDSAWLPSPQPQGVHNSTINELMLPNMKLWDREKSMSMFPLHIANSILEIPLFNMIEEDKLIWIDSPRGHYSVKSGYKVMLNVTGKVGVQSQHDDWHSLWTIHAPPKAKHILWRISKGCLPTRMRLQERHVPCPLSCPLCNNDNEDDWHVLFGCDASIQARQTAGLDVLVQPMIQPTSHARELIHAICSNADKDTTGVFAMLIWLLWNNRNNKVWNDTHETGCELGSKARHLWNEWASI